MVTCYANVTMSLQISPVSSHLKLLYFGARPLCGVLCCLGVQNLITIAGGCFNVNKSCVNLCPIVLHVFLGKIATQTPRSQPCGRHASLLDHTCLGRKECSNKMKNYRMQKQYCARYGCDRFFVSWNLLNLLSIVSSSFARTMPEATSEEALSTTNFPKASS